MDAMTSYGFRVFGNPASQGSKIPGMNRKTGKMFVRDQAGKGLTTWRQDIIRAALIARGCDPDTGAAQSPDVDGNSPTPILTIEGACAVQLQIMVPRPASVPVKKRKHPSVKPDLDKMIRAILDGLKEAGVYRDDGQVVKIWAVKQYAGDTADLAPGAWITVTDHLD